MQHNQVRQLSYHWNHQLKSQWEDDKTRSEIPIKIVDIMSIGANRPTLGGTVPNLTAMSRCLLYSRFLSSTVSACCATISAQLDIQQVLVH